MIKNFLILLALFIPVSSALAQNELAFQLREPGDYQEMITQLESEHGPAAHVDSSQSVFPEQQDKVFESWRALLTDLSGALKAGGFEWSEPLQSYYRFYFNADGTINKVFFKPRDMTDERAEQFGRILNDFAQSYTFPLSANRGFAQCSPATLMPPNS